VLQSGGQRKLGLPDWRPDPTDTDTLLEAFRARRRELCGERRLVLAIFMASLDDLRRYPCESKSYREAVHWLMNDDVTWPLAFRPACETLDLDPRAVRTRVLRALAAQRDVLPGPAPQVLRGQRVPLLLAGAA